MEKNYPIEVYLNLEKEFNNITNELERNLKLYFLYNKISKIYIENNENALGETYSNKKQEYLSYLPDGEDKNKAIDFADRILFSQFIK